jgi:hypothetical protein
VLSDPERTVVMLELPAAARRLAEVGGGPAERRAAARLLAGLAAIGSLPVGLGSDALVLVPSSSGGLRALLLTPDGVRLAGRAGGRSTRKAALRLLDSLSAAR